MNVNPVGNDQNVSQVNKTQDNQKAQNNQQANTVEDRKLRSDTLDISSEAKKLQNVQSKVSQGFYDQSSTLNTTAQNISNAFPAGS